MKDPEQEIRLCYAKPIKYNSNDGPVTDVVCHVVWYSRNITSVVVI